MLDYGENLFTQKQRIKNRLQNSTIVFGFLEFAFIFALL